MAAQDKTNLHDGRADLRELEYRLASARAVLEELDPIAFREYDMLRELVEERRREVEGDVPRYRSRQRAIELILATQNDWMSKSEIGLALEAQGVITSKAEWGVVNTTIHHLVEKGDLIQSGEGSGWDVMIGLPGWPPCEADEY